MTYLVSVSDQRWDAEWRRPHHLLAHLSRQFPVIFVEEPLASPDHAAPALEVSRGHGPRGTDVTVVRLRQPMREPRWIGHSDTLTQATYSRLLGEYLEQQGIWAPVLWLSNPLAVPFVDVVAPGLLVYDIQNALSGFVGAPPQISEWGEALLRQADLVFAAGHGLYNLRRRFNSSTYLFPNGVVLDAFTPAANAHRIARPVDLPASEPILGYMGDIDPRLDYALLAELAAVRPEWQVVIAGALNQMERGQLPCAENLHYVFLEDYNLLPRYLAYFDVGILPYRVDDTTCYHCPPATLPYLAAHKPVVTTPLPDLTALYADYVRVGVGPEQFAQRVEQALHESTAAAQLRRWRELDLLNWHTWSKIGTLMHDLIVERLDQTSPPAPEPAGAARVRERAPQRVAFQWERADNGHWTAAD